MISDTTIIPRLVGFLMGFGLLAAFVSSADTCLLTASSVLTLSVYPCRNPEAGAKRILFGRLAVIFIGLLSLTVSLFNSSIISNLLWAYGIYCGGLLVPLVLLGFPRLASRFPCWLIWLVMVVGGTTSAFFSIYRGEKDATIVGLRGVVVSLLILLAWLPFSRKDKNPKMEKSKQGK